MKIRIADILLEILGIDPKVLPPNTLQFAVEDSKPADVIYRFHAVKELPIPDDSWSVLFQKDAIVVFGKDGLEQRLLLEPNYHTLYGVYREGRDGIIDVFYQEAFLDRMKIDTVLNSFLSLERHFAKRKCYILHCAFLAFKNNAILFTGPSGIGKSTHADLWCKYIDQTHVVNGDRCLISIQSDGTYLANGWPVCGSSGICHVEQYPIKAIVFMQQAKKNQVTALNLMDRFRLLNTQITINHWNQDATQRAMDWLLDLAKNMNIVSYACNMEPSAPTFLKEALGC